MKLSSHTSPDKHFSVSILITTFAVLAIFITIQMIILGKYINYKNIPTSYMVIIIAYWLTAAIIFTFMTTYQVNHKYEKPMRQFAEATRQVANGDFSVYVKPLHTTEKLDFLDGMFLDFNKMVEELGSIETLKTDFFSSVSHEIKTPLSIIQNYAEALQNENLTAEQRSEYTNTILSSSKRLSGLITNILKLNKLDKQAINPITESYNVCRQICDCAVNFENLWEDKNIEFIANVEDTAMIEADESLMELVWNNLLSNAIKFTNPEGTITLCQTSSDTEVIVSITDSGIGMDKETIKHIFDKFYQGDRSHSIEGNGLGLALTLRVLQLSEGSISAVSTVGKGTTFTVRIPATTGKEREYPHE